MATHKFFDLTIVGGGSGGLHLLWNLIQPGRFQGSIAVIDYSGKRQGGLGGTCLNVGCIPKKLLHHAGSLAHAIRSQSSVAFGLPPQLVWDPQQTQWQWQRLTSNMNGYIRSLNFDLWRRIKSAAPQVEYLKGEAVFTSEQPHPSRLSSPYRITVGEDVSLTTTSVVLCTGSTPRMPQHDEGFHHDPRVLTSDGLFWRKEPLGRSVAVVGGGYIALESASALNALGHQVVVYLEEPLRSMDRQCAAMIVAGMEADGVRFVRQSPHTVSLSQLSAFDHILLAIGRVPNIPRGWPGPIRAVHDAETAPHLYALGDVVEGHPQLTPVAHYTARQIADHLVHGKPIRPFPQQEMTSAVFTTPHEYAFSGLSQEEAEASFGAAEVRVYLSRYNPLDVCMLSTAEPEDIPFDHDGSCLAKLICVGPEEKVVGIHFIGPNAAEIIQAFSLALKLGATKASFDQLLAIHPTTAEEFCFLSKTPQDDFIKRAGCGGGGSC